MSLARGCSCFFFFNDTATTEIYTLSLHDALPICTDDADISSDARRARGGRRRRRARRGCPDRKSTRLNSSHSQISYAGFWLKKKKIYSSPVLYVFSTVHRRTSQHLMMINPIDTTL